MPDFDVSKWPPVFQAFAALGAAVAGGLVWLLGIRRRGEGGQTTDRVHAELDTARLRLDVEEVMRATREAIHRRIDEVRDEAKSEIDALEERVRASEIAIARLQARARHR
jgi:hypothetical protein